MGAGDVIAASWVCSYADGYRLYVCDMCAICLFCDTGMSLVLPWAGEFGFGLDVVILYVVGLGFQCSQLWLLCWWFVWLP